VFFKKYGVGIVTLLTLVSGVAVGHYKIFPYEQIQWLKYKIVQTNGHYNERVELFTRSNPKSLYVMLGDSITEEGDWNALMKRDDILNRGISGDTTTGVLRRMEYLGSQPKICFIMIGVNDLSRGSSVEEVFDNYVKIINTLTSQKITPVIQSILLTDRPGLNSKITVLNQKLKQFSRSKNIRFVDLNKKLAPNGVLLDTYSEDGQHLNAKGYTIWAEAVKGYMQYSRELRR